MDFRWFQPLHVKKLSGKKAEKIIRRISQNHFEKDAWLIVLPFGEHKLAAELVQEVYQATGGFDTRTYYRSKMQWTDCREA